MNRILRKHLFTRMDDAQNDLAFGTDAGEEPEVLTRIAEIISLYKSILNPVTPDPNDPATFIPVIGDEKGKSGP